MGDLALILVPHRWKAGGLGAAFRERGTSSATAIIRGKLVNLDFKMMDPGLLLSMLLVPQFVNGAEPAVQASTASVTFESILRRVTAQGKDKNFEGLKRFPQIPKGSPTKVEWGFSKDAEDGHRRLFSVILDRSTETPKAAYVELYVEHKGHAGAQSAEFLFPSRALRVAERVRHHGGTLG